VEKKVLDTSFYAVIDSAIAESGNMNKNVDFKKTDENMSPKKTSRLAIYSLICAVVSTMLILLSGILTFIGPLRRIEGIPGFAAFVFSHLAFLLGIAALIAIAFNRKKLRGTRYALYAILLSIPFLLITAGGICVARGRVEQAKIGYGRQISETLIRYAKDHNDYLPDANQWCDLLIEYHRQLPKDRFKYDPEKYRFKYDSSKEGVCNYAFNRSLSGLRLDNIPYKTVLVFESKGKWNLSGTEELFRKTPKKRQYVYIYTKDAEIGHDFPRAIHIKDADYERVLW
jgi:hypothetical protein